ncbi:ATP-binding protein [Streptomyces sp. Tue6028]|uniref:ATP-binding protein n=1 Tax=Streptomyces sp. Tue6028 TaxID=2036037 RepID=UPI003D75A601
MYVGSTGERGLHQLVFEVVDRAVNEVLAGRARSVDVTLNPDGSVRVTDDGPGIPVAAAGDTETPSLEALLTRMPAAAQPGGRHTVTMGLFGIGPSVTNALSSRLTAEVRRNGTRWVQEYVRGEAVAPLARKGPTARTGTTIAFQPDADIFSTVECSFDVLAQRFSQLAFLNPNLTLALTDRRPTGQPRSRRFSHPGGVRDLVASLDAQAAAHADIIGFEHEDPRMAGTMEVALGWSDTAAARVHSFANSSPTPEGGTHVAGFRDGAAAAVNTFARERQLLEATEPDIGADRIIECLTVVVSVKLDRPEFEGATRGLLGGAAVHACVQEAVQEHMGTWLEEHPKLAAAVIGRTT